MNIHGVTTVRETPELFIKVYPNPANEIANIGFNVKSEGFIQLSVYDILGRKIKDVLSKTLQEGNYNEAWNLTDQSGKRVENGVYFARISGSENAKSAKIIVR